MKPKIILFLFKRDRTFGDTIISWHRTFGDTIISGDRTFGDTIISGDRIIMIRDRRSLILQCDRKTIQYQA